MEVKLDECLQWYYYAKPKLIRDPNQTPLSHENERLLTVQVWNAATEHASYMAFVYSKQENLTGQEICDRLKTSKSASFDELLAAIKSDADPHKDIYLSGDDPTLIPRLESEHARLEEDDSRYGAEMRYALSALVGFVKGDAVQAEKDLQRLLASLNDPF